MESNGTTALLTSLPCARNLCHVLPAVACCRFQKKLTPMWMEGWIQWHCLLCYPLLVSTIYIEKKAQSESKNNLKICSFAFTKNLNNILERTAWAFHDPLLLSTERAFSWKHKRILTTSLCLHLSLTDERNGGFKEGWTAPSVHTEINRYHRELSPEWHSYRKWRGWLKTDQPSTHRVKCYFEELCLCIL